MKKYLFALVFLLVLAACATDPINLQRQYANGCTAYLAAFKTVNTLDSQNKLNAAEIATVTQTDKTVTPLCAKTPADLNTSIAQITQATTLLTVQIIADKVSKK